MAKDNLRPQRTKEEQYRLNNLAKSLSILFGAEIVSKDEFDAVNQEKSKLLGELEDAQEIQNLSIKYYCHFLGFKQYHSKWKSTTRKIEKRTQTLIDEGLLVQFNNVPEDVKSNLDEAYKTYIHGQEISCYVMLLRTVEIMINHIFLTSDNLKHIPAKQKFDWLNKNGYFSGTDSFLMKAFIEGRNEAIHTVFKPTKRQLFSAFETVITLVKKFLEQREIKKD